MFQEIEQLLLLQDRDQRIRTLKMELKNAPLERAAVEGRLAAANSGAEQVKLKVRELEVQKNKLAVEAQGKRDQINKFKTQQMQTRKNEEYLAFANEIAHFEKLVQGLEDQELELMEKIENTKPLLVEAEKGAVVARSLVATQLADLDAKITVIHENLAKVEVDREGLSKKVEEDLLDQYNRLFASKGGNAVVALRHDVCMGCHMKLTTQTSVRVKGSRSITYCEQCGRMLYWAE